MCRLQDKYNQINVKKSETIGMLIKEYLHQDNGSVENSNSMQGFSSSKYYR